MFDKYHKYLVFQVISMFLFQTQSLYQFILLFFIIYYNVKILTCHMQSYWWCVWVSYLVRQLVFRGDRFFIKFWSTNFCINFIKIIYLLVLSFADFDYLQISSPALALKIMTECTLSLTSRLIGSKISRMKRAQPKDFSEVS